MDKTLADKIEALVDAHGLFNVIEALQGVCYDKSEHLASNWQDDHSARTWTKAGVSLNKVLDNNSVRAI